MQTDVTLRGLRPDERRTLVPHRYAVGVAGYPGVGKTTAAELFSDHLDAAYVNSGDLVRRHAREALGEDVDDEAIGAWIDEVRQEHGAVIVCEWLVSELQSARPAPYAVVDGVREVPGAELTDCFSRFFLVLLHVDERERHRRLERREGRRSWRGGDSRHPDRDEREEAYGLPELYENHDFFIENEGSLSALRSSVADVVARLPTP